MPGGHLSIIKDIELLNLPQWTQTPGHLSIKDTDKISVRILGTRYEARNCISAPDPQEPYRDIFFLKRLLVY
jgi:hypothetical protein